MKLMNALYCTGDTIGEPSGAGAVCQNELEALRASTDVALVLQARDNIHPAYAEHGITFLNDYFALARVSDKGSPPINLAHFYSGCYSMTARWLKARGTLITYTSPAHDRDESIAESKLLFGSHPFPHITDDGLFSLHMACLREADIVIAPSNESAKFLVRYGVAQERIAVIPHGSDPPVEVPPIPAFFNVGYLGQTGPDKGLLYLIKAWGMLGYDDHTSLILAGNGTAQLKPLIQHNAAKGHFALLGYIDQPATLYSAVSVYVQPSVTEGFGIEVLEAMGHGRPVIVSEGAGASLIVTDGIDGFIVSRRDPTAIAERIAYFRDNPHRIIEMGAQARRTAMLHTWEKVRQRYQETWALLWSFRGRE